MHKQTESLSRSLAIPARFDRTWHEPYGRRFRSARMARDGKLWLMGSWLVLVFLLGGSAREDVESLLILRPLSALVLAYGLWSLKAEQLAAHRFLLGLAAAWGGLHLLQLIPLPPQWWQNLPGREVIALIDRTTGLEGTWRPLTMVPHGTRNAAWALLPPLAVLLLGIQLSSQEREKLLPLAIGLGILSAGIGALQLAADSGSALYFYRITNHGSPVGLFANRNHQAIFLALLLPMVLTWAALRIGAGQSGTRSSRTYWALAACGIVFLTPLILITGSRAGLVIALLCLLALPAMFADLPGLGHSGAPAIGRTRRLRMASLLSFAVVGLALLTALLGRDLALDRLLASDGSDLRLQVVGTLQAMISQYSPWGSGLGSFAEVYKLHEPNELLGPAYLNHAHNDWLELALTGGWPAIALAGIAAAGFVLQLVRIARSTEEDRNQILLARLGLLILPMLALASLGDYPLRTPALACLAVLAALWATPRTGAPVPDPQTCRPKGNHS